MKKALLTRFLLVSILLTWVVMGNRSVQTSDAQTQPVPQPAANLTAASASNVATAGALPPDIAPNSPLAQVVSLVQAGVEQSVILNYINNSTALFNLNADQIIYLNDLGVPAAIINAMMQRDQQLQQMGVAPAQSAPPVAATQTQGQPAVVTVNYFYDTLAPYGTWMDVAGYGWCWRPTVVVYDTGWQPYCNNGHWVYTDYGWYWLSGYSWGWATFHYGRWFRIPRYGWCWWPDTTWAPSWVCWRYDRDYCGWAPLPPRAFYRPGVGLFYDGHAVSAGFHFNLGVSAFTFVRTRDFAGRQPWRHRLGEREAEHIFARTRNVHQFDFDRHNRTIINPGIPVHDITAVTKQPIHRVAIQYETGGRIHNNRHEQFERSGRTLVVNRLHFTGSRALTPQPRSVTPANPGGNRNYGRNGLPSVHGNQNNPPHSEMNQNPNRNFNRGVRQPQTPRIGQPVVPHSVTPPSTEHNRTIVNPHQNSITPNQNQAPRQNNANHRQLSPRRQQIERESPRSYRQNSPRGNDQRVSAPPANRYSNPAQQQPNRNYRRVPQNESRRDTQRHTVRPGSAPHSSSPAPHADPQDRNNHGH